MEQRKAKVLFNKNGNGYTTTRITLPVPWIQELDLNPEDRDVKITLKDKKIIIEKL